MTNQQVTALEKLAGLGAHKAFALEILRIPQILQILSSPEKNLAMWQGQIKGIAFPPTLIVVNGFKIG